MARKNRILVLTADAGFGHRSAANAIVEAINDQYGEDTECKIINPIDDPRVPAIIRKPQIEYDQTIQNHPELYYLSYQISDSQPASAVVKNVISQLMAQVFRDMLIKYQPDVIISTYLLYNMALRRAMTANGMNIPFLSVITDLANVHNLWFQPGPDKYFVASDDVRNQAVQHGIPPENLIVTGLPVDHRIANEKRSKPEIRRALGWDPLLTTILAVSSKRVKDFTSKLQAIESCAYPIQLIVVAGGDTALYDQVRSRKCHIPTHTYNFVDNLPEMLLAADILATKAGGLIVSEGLACALPIILIDFIVGQETGNVDYVCKHAAGVEASTPEAIGQTLSQWLENDQKLLKQFTSNARQIGRPLAAYQIAQEARNILETSVQAWQPINISKQRILSKRNRTRKAINQ